MNSEEIALSIQSELGPDWPRIKPIPIGVLAPLCEALWDAGKLPTRSILKQCLPAMSMQALAPAGAEWRRQKGLSQMGRGARASVATNLEDVAKVVSPPVATAPLTCFDPTNDGRWLCPSTKVLTYLVRIENRSIRDVMALFAALKAEFSQGSVLSQIAGFTLMWRHVMTEQIIEEVCSVDPNDLLFRIHSGEAGQGLTRRQRQSVFVQWKVVQHAFEEYAERLSEGQRLRLAPFFIKPLTNRLKLLQARAWATYNGEQQARAKLKTDAVQSQFYRIRHLAWLRCNQVGRLYAAVGQTIAGMKGSRCPHDFSYEETVEAMRGRKIRQRIELTLWDCASLFERARTHGFEESPPNQNRRENCQGIFSREKPTYVIEYRGTVSLTAGGRPEPFWFLELFRNHVFVDLDRGGDEDLHRKRAELYRNWGYETTGRWSDASGMLVFRQELFRVIRCLTRKAGHEFIPHEGIYAATHFGALAVRMATITGSRLGEVQQIAQSADCIKKLVNVGPKGATRWLLRLVPKGQKTSRADYYIDEDTKNLLLNVIRFQTERYGNRSIPIVASEFGKMPPDHYVLQWRKRAVDQGSLNTFIRFLLHGLAFRASDGTAIQLTSHVLRHAFATELATLNVPVDIIAKILHQRDTTVTKYYSQPTATQVLAASELIFVDRIDVGAEVLRNPEEIGRALEEAAGRIGALTEVIGGTCVVGNMCPAKFACVGCPGNSPDPAKRRQIERKMEWADKQARHAAQQQLPAEQRQMEKVVADCNLMLQEMDLIEAARADQSQLVHIEHTPR
jgi:integrase